MEYTFICAVAPSDKLDMDEETKRRVDEMWAELGV